MMYGFVVPIYILSNALLGWYSIAAGGHNFTDKLILAAINCLPIWLLVSRFSRNQMFDTILINIVGTSSYMTVILLLDARLHFSAINCCGLTLAFIGLILMKIETKNNPA